MLRAFSKRFVYVLIAALLLTQQGVVLHALAHGVDALKSVSQERPDKRAPLSERHCDLCLTYAQVGAGAAPVTPVAFAAALEHSAPQTFHHPTGALVTRAYHSRAPPAAV
jgi:hypothetical protein